MDQKMARVDISLIVRDKSARIKKGRCVYTIASRDFPKGPGNPISGREEAEDTTPHRLVMLGLVAALKRIRRPSLILSLIHISEPTRRYCVSRMPSSA